MINQLILLSILSHHTYILHNIMSTIMSSNAVTAKSIDMRTSSFRFLDLPIELRVMVYKYLVPTVHQQTVTGLGEYFDTEVVVTTQNLSTDILRTCKLIQAEAHPILKKELVILFNQPLRIQCDAQNLFHILKGYGTYGDIISLFPQRLLVHLNRLPRVEIAFTTSSDYTLAEYNKYLWRDGIWSVYHDLWCGARDSGLKVDLFHRGTVDHLITHQGPDEYSARTFLAMVEWDGETEELNFDSIANIRELDEELFDEMMELWKEGKLIEHTGHVVDEVDDEDEAYGDSTADNDA